MYYRWGSIINNKILYIPIQKSYSSYNLFSLSSTSLDGTKCQLEAKTSLGSKDTKLVKFKRKTPSLSHVFSSCLCSNVT